ncbi:NADP-dependent oxidoreductase [Cryptosporangium arvum]|uniref:NADP-dependent oxidoreductase n=1 Tax=Cryptosporangium arvum TaxID=80871 RepID=UPI00055A9103|nr:NADP-dependent oxidoreductase [Cryptosporangium arvum]
MRSVVVREFGGPEVLEVAEVPVPGPGAGQVRIAVAGAGVNPVDAQTRSGALTAGGLLPPRPVVGLGWDVSGTVDAVGAGVGNFAVGDRVLALSDRIALSSKAQADFVVLDADAVAHCPGDVDLIDAATLPLGALTAAQALDLTGRPDAGTLLVTGAAGAVGGYAAELAVRAGLRVIAVAGPRDEEWLRTLGVEAVVPRDADLADSVRALVPGGVSAAIDAANLGAVTLDAVRGGGVFVAVLGGGPVPLRGVRVEHVWIRADGPRLESLAAAHLRLRVADVLPLTDVAGAHRRLEAGGLRGRLVLRP